LIQLHILCHTSRHQACSPPLLSPSCPPQGYLALARQAKDSRLQELLRKTDDIMAQLGELVGGRWRAVTLCRVVLAVCCAVLCCAVLCDSLALPPLMPLLLPDGLLLQSQALARAMHQAVCVH
jgi:hypothetical protein